MKSYIAYGISIIVIVTSACLIIFLPLSNEIKTIFSLPSIAGLFSLLVQGWRDQVAHERAIVLQQKKNEFDLAIASHMANLVFDKQVNFCEKYSQKLNAIVRQMFQEGPSDKTSMHENELSDIRIEYAPWISKELTEKVKPFEYALREIGALGMLERQLPNDPNRPKYIEKMYGIYTKFLGINMEGVPEEPESAADAVLAHFSDVLNIFDLETLRHRAIRLAIEQSQQ